MCNFIVVGYQQYFPGIPSEPSPLFIFIHLLFSSLPLSVLWKTFFFFIRVSRETSCAAFSFVLVSSFLREINKIALTIASRELILYTS